MNSIRCDKCKQWFMLSGGNTAGVVPYHICNPDEDYEVVINPSDPQILQKMDIIIRLLKDIEHYVRTAK